MTLVTMAAPPRNAKRKEPRNDNEPLTSAEPWRPSVVTFECFCARTVEGLTYIIEAERSDVAGGIENFLRNAGKEAMTMFDIST
jgi:hypothetical protein